MNADLLLVPYIDLLTCMVAFLLITAVWTQLARLEVQQKGQGESLGEVIADSPRLAVVVHGDGFTMVNDRDQQPIPQTAGTYDYARLGRELKRLKDLHPDAVDLKLMSEDGIRFEVLVKTMDVAMGAGFPGLSLLDAGQAGL